MRHTRTYVTMGISKAAYDEIKAKMEEAGYDHAIDERDGLIDMHGIAVEIEEIPDREEKSESDAKPA